MMATVPHLTSGSGLRKFQAHGFFFDSVYDFEITKFLYKIFFFIFSTAFV